MLMPFGTLYIGVQKLRDSSTLNRIQKKVWKKRMITKKLKSVLKLRYLGALL
jgi:hypothetical protein